MSDYNSNEIPTLDDVIDDDLSTQIDNLEAAEPVQQENSEAADHSADTNSAVGTKVDSHADRNADSSDAYSSDTDSSKDTGDEISASLQPPRNPFYPTPGSSHTSVQISYQEVYDKLRAQHLSQAAEVPSIDLDTITESVTKQIMPELEQQLKSLIQQVLTEKLPADIIKSIDTDDSDNADNNNHFNNE